ncbi:MAG: hypothetical protein J3Q66DRAFT_81537 [Benniella sp.]|nr:MAG: hypothetical protein J3Q66DRAFT_81537 [Benniella sp.]
MSCCMRRQNLDKARRCGALWLWSSFCSAQFAHLLSSPLARSCLLHQQQHCSHRQALSIQGRRGRFLKLWLQHQSTCLLTVASVSSTTSSAVSLASSFFSFRQRHRTIDSTSKPGEAAAIGTRHLGFPSNMNDCSHYRKRRREGAGFQKKRARECRRGL